MLFFILAFTRVPYDVHRWLGLHGSEYTFKPDYIVFLGGSGMPSESNLIRLDYTSKIYKSDTTVNVLVVHPVDTTVIRLIVEELAVKGVDRKKILIEKNGTNTREQVLQIADDYHEFKDEKIVLVTSPENMLRSVLSFRKAGFKYVGGEAAFENAMFVNLGYNHKKIGGKQLAPDVGSNMKLRYDFWNYLKLEIVCMRELVALTYYKMNGWI